MSSLAWVLETKLSPIQEQYALSSKPSLSSSLPISFDHVLFLLQGDEPIVPSFTSYPTGDPMELGESRLASEVEILLVSLPLQP